MTDTQLEVAKQLERRILSFKAAITTQIKAEIGGCEISTNTQRMLSQKWQMSGIQYTGEETTIRREL